VESVGKGEGRGVAPRESPSEPMATCVGWKRQGGRLWWKEGRGAKRRGGKVIEEGGTGFPRNQKYLGRRGRGPGPVQGRRKSKEILWRICGCIQRGTGGGGKVKRRKKGKRNGAPGRGQEGLQGTCRLGLGIGGGHPGDVGDDPPRPKKEPPGHLQENQRERKSRRKGAYQFLKKRKLKHPQHAEKKINLKTKFSTKRSHL